MHKCVKGLKLFVVMTDYHTKMDYDNLLAKQP